MIGETLSQCLGWGASWSVRDLEMRIMNVFLLCPRLENSAEEFASGWFADESTAIVREALDSLVRRGAVERETRGAYRLKNAACNISLNSTVLTGLTR